VEGLEPNPTQMDALVSLRANVKLSSSHLIDLAGVEKSTFSSLTHAEAIKVITFAMHRRRENARNYGEPIRI
jgi:hypothetical protein